MLRHRSVSRVLQKTEMHEYRVGSVASLTLAFFIIQYFLINKGVSVTSDIKICFCPGSLMILV